MCRLEKLQLDYFLSVAETLNISKSAEILCISQPSLSQTIKKLEGEIGYPLFDRNGKHISLNKNGHIFLECVRHMKRLYENALEEIAETNNRCNRQISINMRCASLLLEESFISLNPSWSLEQMIQMACEKKSFVPNVLIRLDNPDLLRRLLVEKLGLAFVPEKTWGKAFSNGEFDLCPVSDLPIKRYVYVVWKEGFVRENVRECIHCIEDFFSESIS